MLFQDKSCPLISLLPSPLFFQIYFQIQNNVSRFLRVIYKTWARAELFCECSGVDWAVWRSSIRPRNSVSHWSLQLRCLSCAEHISGGNVTLKSESVAEQECRIIAIGALSPVTQVSAAPSGHLLGLQKFRYFCWNFTKYRLKSGLGTEVSGKSVTMSPLLSSRKRLCHLQEDIWSAIAIGFQRDHHKMQRAL